MSLREKILRLSGYQLMGSVATILIGTFSSVFYARFLGPLDFGRMNFIIWLLTIAGVIAGMGFNGTLTRYVGYYEGKGDRATTEQVIFICLLAEVSLASLLTALLWLFTNTINSFFSDPLLSSCFVILLLTIVPSSFVDILRFSLTGMQRIRELSINNVVFQALTLAGNTCLLLFGYGLEAIFYLNFVIVVIKAVNLLNILRKSMRIRWGFPCKTILSELGRYNLHLTVIVITDQIIWQRSEIFFLQKFSTPDQIAFYSLAFGWGIHIIGFLPGILGAFLIPVMSELYGGDKQEKISRSFYQITRYASLILIPLTIGTIAVSVNFINLFYGADYAAVPAMMVPIFISKGFISLYISASAVIFASGRQTFIMRWGLVLAALNLILDYYLICEYGGLGAAWATSIVHFLAAVITLVYVIRYLHLAVPFGFQFKLLILCLALYPVAYFVSTHFFNAGGLIAAVLLFAALYIASLPLIRVFSVEDRETFLSITGKLPARMQPLLRNYFSLWHMKAHVS